MTEQYGLIRDRLLKSPEQFEARGEGNALLKEHFNGAPVGLLRPLLRHDNASVRSTAMFVANELGAIASEVVDDIVPLIRDSDAHIQWDALESVMVCSFGQHVEKFLFVIQELQNPNSPICRLAMRLVSNSSDAQIEAGLRLVDRLRPKHAAHKRGLENLVNCTEEGRARVINLLDDSDDLIQKYGAIAAKRHMEESPKLIHHAAMSENEMVAQFSLEALS